LVRGGGGAANIAIAQAPGNFQAHQAQVTGTLAIGHAMPLRATFGALDQRQEDARLLGGDELVPQR
jgi:hypothetical protein